jgi:hypothetical protein
MTDIMHQQVLAVLQNDWAKYVESFYRLSPEEQRVFLTRQGYTRLADLLAHVTAWWGDGIQVIESLLADPGFALPRYDDIDGFNARAVAGVRDQDEPAVITSFEAMRQRMLQLVSGLSDAAWENRYVIKRLKVEVIGHLEEHALPEK